ncbi:MAG TPA: lipid II flippase MurJ, partial [Candidatus Bathyarchaeia archaeon]|nr:lipid II flippase MurJ [Candidatus Bathyarchaeia archaeon]
ALVRRLIDRLFPRGALTLSILSLAYFGMGLIRNRVFANTFGAGAELDAYNAAFRIPEIALDILVASGISAPFVPIFMRLREGEDAQRRAETFGRTVLTVAVLVMAVALGFLFLAGPWLADTVWRDFDLPTRALYVDLFRINCLAQVLFAASITLGEILVAHRRFFFYALAPILYTGGIVLGTLLLGPTMGIDGAAFGALAGAVAHLGVRAVGVARTGFRIGPALAVRTAEFREFVRLMLPRMLSYPIDPIVVFFMTKLATAEGPGNATALSFVLDYQFVPVQIIAIAFSIAAFPTLSALFAEGDGVGFRRLLIRNVATIGALTAVAGLVLAVLAHLLIQVFLGGGKFDASDVALTASLLVAFAVSIPVDSLSYPLSRGLYATHNTIYQVLASIAGLIVLVAVSQVLLPSLGIIAIPVGYTAGGLAKLVILVLALVPRVRRIDRPAPDGAEAA